MKPIEIACALCGKKDEHWVTRAVKINGKPMLYVGLREGWNATKEGEIFCPEHAARGDVIHVERNAPGV